MLGKRLLERQAGVYEKGRAEQGEITHRRPDVCGVEDRVADIGDAQKAIRMVVFPEGTRRVELDVAPNGLELARVEGKLDVGAAVEAERRTDGGLRPPAPPAEAWVVPAEPPAARGLRRG